MAKIASFLASIFNWMNNSYLPTCNITGTEKKAETKRLCLTPMDPVHDVRFNMRMKPCRELLRVNVPENQNPENFKK